VHRQNGNEQCWFNVLVGAAAFYEGRFLLLRRSRRETFLPEVWGIPAGQVKHYEDPRDACLRELEEETGLVGRIIDLVGYSTFASRKGARELDNVQLNFLVEVPDDNVEIDKTSHSTFDWISADNTDDERIDDFTRDIVKSACSYLTESGRPEIVKSLGI
jgi:8-oxo-dGTP diphosphatase